MATAGLNRMMLWTDLEGRELSGGWILRRLVRPEGRIAWFEATGADGRPAILSITETLNDDDELLERLRAAAEIRHPNVVAIHASMVSRVDDTPVVIAAMEPTEENLGDVLRERALSVAEARQVLDALLAGLVAIHSKGLVHGRMEAASVLATGETIKLRSDCLLIGSGARAAEDVRGAARIVTQAVTRRIPTGENDPVLQLLPDPMARAVRRALSGQAGAAEIAALVGTRLELLSEVAREKKPSVPAVKAATPPVVAKEEATSAEARIAGAETAAKAEAAESPTETPTARVIPMKTAEVPAAPAQTAAAGQSAAPQPLPRQTVLDALAATPAARVPRAGSPERPQLSLPLTEAQLLTEDDEPNWERRRSAPYVIGAAVVLVLITIIVLWGILHRKPATPQRPTQTAPAVVAPTTQRSNPPVTRKPTAMTTRGAAAAAGSGIAQRPGWRVVAYTYNHQARAQQKADELAKRYPQLQPSVYAPKGHAPYLVTLGGAGSRGQAIALREKALRMGLPRDTYAQNFR